MTNDKYSFFINAYEYQSNIKINPHPTNILPGKKVEVKACLTQMIGGCGPSVVSILEDPSSG
jgi:hypothetical protein